MWTVSRAGSGGSASVSGGSRARSGSLRRRQTPFISHVTSPRFQTAAITSNLRKELRAGQMCVSEVQRPRPAQRPPRHDKPAGWEPAPQLPTTGAAKHQPRDVLRLREPPCVRLGPAATEGRAPGKVLTSCRPFARNGCCRPLAENARMPCNTLPTQRNFKLI